MRKWMLGLVALAGLFGAAGIGAAALAAHVSVNPDLRIAAYFLLFHAAAIIGVTSVAVQPRGGFLAAASTLALGTLLFSGDLTLRALVGHRLFPLAAPTGGTLLILGWLILTGVAVAALFSPKSA